MNAAPHKFRAASNGKPFTTREKINMILAEKDRKSRNAELRAAVAEAKNEIAREKQAREVASKVRKALIENPTIKKVHVEPNGKAWFQPRVNGKFQARVTVN